MITDDIILEIKNVSKQFGKIRALHNVSVDIKSGEILAILGENGAGKSTLMKILSGLYQPDTGSVSINKNWFINSGKSNSQYHNTMTDQLQQIELKSPNFSMKLGIGQVYQHFQLVETFSVTENIMLGKEFTYKNTPIINKTKAAEEVKKIGELYGLPIDPNSIVEDLPVGLKQRVEILKQLFRDSRLLILDEPTAVLTPTETKELFRTMRKLKDAGKSIIFISHKLNEPLEIADRIITIRAGEIVGEILPKNATKEILAEMIVGRKIISQLDRSKVKDAKLILEIKNLTVKGLYDENVVSEVSLQSKSHTILGIAGVQGNGQTELLDALMGLRRVESGKIILHNLYDLSAYDITHVSTIDRIKRGIAYIPEDRTTQGLILQYTVQDNIWLGFYGDPGSAINYLNVQAKYTEDKKTKRKSKPHLSKEKDEHEEPRSYLSKIALPFHIMMKLTKAVIRNLDVRGGDGDTVIANLSGGNQQKVLIGREFAKQPSLIIASQPTRGVDIGVMENVHEELIDRRNGGAAIILVSSDLDEILKLADEIAVIYEGKIAGYGSRDELTISEISQMMTSGKIEKQAMQNEVKEVEK